MVRESALLQAGGARWADSNANEHATNVAGGKQARRARWAGDVQQIAGGKGEAIVDWSFEWRQLGWWPRCVSGAAAERARLLLGHYGHWGEI